MNVLNLTGEYALQCPELENKIPFGYIDKTICGCGITTIALENDRDTIILVPNVNLIKNKCTQYPNSRSSNILLGVYAGVNKKDIEGYTKTITPIKILVTYDGLSKVEHLLESCDIVVDESDRLLANVKLKVNSKTNRSKDVISYLFDTLQNYKDKVSFVSATPIPTKYLPQWVGDLPKTTLEWKDTQICTPYILSRGNPYKALTNEILKPLADTGSVVVDDLTITKVLIFINSVTEIKKIIQASGIDPNEVGYIVGDTIVNDTKLNSYTRVENPHNLPKYTFVTSTGFQGIDLYDKEVISIVVSSTGKSFTMIDISTDLKQAISRQRDKSNIHYGKYIFIYDQTFFSESEETLLNKIAELRVEIEETIKLYEWGKNANLKGGTKRLEKDKDVVAYTTFNEETNTLEINENVFNADKYFLLETRNQYKRGFKIKGLTGATVVKPVIIPREVRFADLAKHLKMELKTNTIDNINWSTFSTRTEWKNLLIQHYKLFGKVIADYNKTKNMIEAGLSAEGQMKVDVQSVLKIGTLYSRKEIKEALDKIYKKYKVKRKASHRDLYTWFDCIEKRIKGYDYMEIIKKK